MCTSSRLTSLTLIAFALVTAASCGSSGPGGQVTGTGGTTGNGGAIGAGGTTTGSGGAVTGAGGSAGAVGAGGTPATGGATGTGGVGGAGGSGGLVCASPAPTGASFAVDASGVTFTLNPGREKVFVYKEDIVRVEYTNANALPTKASLSVSNTWSTPTPFCVSESAGSVTITTSRIKVTVNETTGVVTYTDLSGAALVSEASKSLTAATVEGVATSTVQATFNSPANEALFGLGQHQDGVINRKGTRLLMLKANTEIQIPVLVSY
jgi:alpha-D-xyloside xylohydrolase